MKLSFEAAPGSSLPASTERLFWENYALLQRPCNVAVTAVKKNINFQGAGCRSVRKIPTVFSEDRIRRLLAFN
jgi:hypothetical protein